MLLVVNAGSSSIKLAVFDAGLAQVLPALNHFSLVDALVGPKQRANRVWRQVIG